MGTDLYEVKRWPIEKKLTYQEHMLVEAQLQQQEMDYGDMDSIDVPDMDSMPSNPKKAMQQAQSMGGDSQGHSSGTHPHLQRYDTIVNVTGEDDDEGDD